MTTNTDIKILKHDETWIKVLCSEVHQEMDIQDRFSFEIPNAKHDPRVKARKWDGIKRLYNRQTKKLYKGLLLSLLEFLNDQKFTYELDPELLPDEEDQLSTEDIQNLIDKIIQPKDKNGNPLSVYDYQVEAVKNILNSGNSISLAATSSGKSLIIYLAVRIYQLLDDLNNKTICITVPSISLVEQLYKDFEEYATNSSWSVHKHCQKISGKYKKQVEKQIFITTWQSQQKMSYDDLQSIGCIFIDECHTAQASTLTSILESLVRCRYKHGLTGTLSDSETNQMTVQGLLGPAQTIVTAKENIDAGRATDVIVNMVVLNYQKNATKKFLEYRKDYLKGKRYEPRLAYESEVRFLASYEPRLNLILDMIESVEGNSLIIFDRVESYGEVLYNKFKERRPDNTFFISGSVSGSDREDIRLDMENHDDATIWASSETMSTGVSINKLHNCFIISSSKSRRKIIQIAGRLMRLHKSKTKSQLYDIVDNLNLENKENFTLLHAQKRIEIYDKEKFSINFMQLDI